MDKVEFSNRLKEFTERCLVFAESQSGKSYPKNVRYTLGFYDHENDSFWDAPLKYLGGKLISREQIFNLSPKEIVKLHYIDGKVPLWVNLYFHKFDQEYSYIRVVSAKDITDDDSHLYNMPEGSNQFRIAIDSEVIDAT